MIHRRTLLLACISAAASGCAHRLASPEDYDEQVTNLAITPKGDQLAVVGERFDYVLQPPMPLVLALRSALRSSLSAEFTTFELGSPSEISGKWQLIYLTSAASAESIQLASGLGFVPDGPGRHILKGNIAGTRYRKAAIKSSGSLEKTNRVYSIHVRRSTLFANSEMRTSPLSGSNGMVFIGMLVLLPLIKLLLK